MSVQSTLDKLKKSMESSDNSITGPDRNYYDEVNQEIVVVKNKPKSTSPGSFSINSFISDIRNRGVVRSHSFLVNIVPPKILRNTWSDTRNILIRCDSAAIPAANFQMSELYRHGYGVQESTPHNVQFEPVNLSFIMDSQAEVYTFWYRWLNGVMNFNLSKGLNTSDEKEKMGYEMAYKDDYATDIRILVYNEAADNILQSSLMQAFPLGMSETVLNWSASDEIIRLNIPISYRDFYTQTSYGDTSKNISNFLSSTIPQSQLNKRSIKDNFSLIGFNNIPGRLTSKLDNLISDILLG